MAVLSFAFGDSSVFVVVESRSYMNVIRSVLGPPAIVVVVVVVVVVDDVELLKITFPTYLSGFSMFSL